MTGQSGQMTLKDELEKKNSDELSVLFTNRNAHVGQQVSKLMSWEVEKKKTRFYRTSKMSDTVFVNFYPLR